MRWEPLVIALVVVSAVGVSLFGLLRRQHPSDPSMFNYALWPQAAYTTARWTGALCYVAFAVTVVYGMLGMAFGWFDGYGNDWWRSALRVAAAMCLVLELGTALDFLTDGKPGFKRRHPKWPALDAAHKRRHFLKYTISATVLMLAANVFVWLGLEAVLP